MPTGLFGALGELAQDQSVGAVTAAGDTGWKVQAASDVAENQWTAGAEILSARLAVKALSPYVYHMDAQWRLYRSNFSRRIFTNIFRFVHQLRLPWGAPWLDWGHRSGPRCR